MQKGFSVIFIIIVVGILGLIGAGSFYLFNKQQLSAINSFEGCAKKYPVMESYPAQCNTPDGRHFVEDIKDSTSSSEIVGQNRLDSPSLWNSNEVQQTPATSSTIVDPTSNWKTYESEEMNVTFKYPGWSLNKEVFGDVNSYVKFEILGSMFVLERQNISMIDLDWGGDVEFINGKQWKHTLLIENDSRCESENCLKVSKFNYGVYSILKDEYQYSFFYPSDSEEVTIKVLTTFKFINN